MIATVHSTVGTRVSIVPAHELRELMRQVRALGVRPVIANRTHLFEALHDLGDEEASQQAKRQRQYLLDVFV